MVKLRILALAALLLPTSATWACTPNILRQPPPARLPDESDAAFSARQSAFNEMSVIRYNQQVAVWAADGALEADVMDAQRQDRLWDNTATILLTHVVSIESAVDPSQGDRVRYQTDRVLKGRSRISMVDRAGTSRLPLPPCFNANRGVEPTVGAAVIVFLPTPRSTTVEPTHTIPLVELRSERLWAIINGTAPTP